MGAGWHDDEHRRHGFAFPSIAERADMLEEQLAIVRGLLEGPDGWSFEGAHYRVEDALFRPKPHPMPPIITGGEGSPRGLRIAARWADEFNLVSTRPEAAAVRLARLDDACRAAAIPHAAGDGRRPHRAGPRRVGRRTQCSSRRSPGRFPHWSDARRPRWVRPTSPRRDPPVRRRRCRARRPGLPADRSAMIDLMGEVLVGRG
jgi:hypothetical protein